MDTDSSLQNCALVDENWGLQLLLGIPILHSCLIITNKKRNYCWWDKHGNVEEALIKFKVSLDMTMMTCNTSCHDQIYNFSH